MALPVEKERYTFADALTWLDDERAELIGGEPIMMAPPTTAHQLINGEIFRQLANYLEGKKCHAIPAPFAVRLFEKDGNSPEDVDTMVEPDISVICDKDKLSDRGCKGAPDWIIEIISPSSTRTDCAIKLFKYRTAGVREYWIINPMKKVVQTYTFEGEEDANMYSFDDEIPVYIFDGLTITISDLL